MSRTYLDASAALKRCIVEAESFELKAYLDAAVADGAALLSSDLSRIEVSRALLRVPEFSVAQRARAMDEATGDVALEPMGADVVALAMRVGPELLRTLDAIHLATAVLLDVDRLVTYDDRLAEAAASLGVPVDAPGH